MKIDFNKLTYRKSTVALVLNKDDEILIVQKHSFKPNEWDFPGGGIDEGEKAEETILRELKEELGSEKFVIKNVSRELDKYNWPEDVIMDRFTKHGKTYLGQERVRFLVKYLGEKAEIKAEKDEFREYKWVELGLMNR
ncbi:MAG: RNA pyrophosphohydrolase [Candidatus Shapirobacteria bacterium GW2011_GWF1_38_23]|nr:MAG: RNA pyrophosphohydrolase [Candidatus Shapirobacteria bacterium GW2011_GWF1_38_23]